ncbi:MAG: NAD(P)H-dependent oxidoreductase [Clostridia bacterium]|nr:NAD(P)H-dependent oxidoreductase [Clostridia bacterium]
MKAAKKPLIVIAAGDHARLRGILESALADIPHKVIRATGLMPQLSDARILFALSVGEVGLDADICSLLIHLRSHPDALAGSIGSIIIDGAGELYTKQLAHMLLLSANSAGCLFPGKPLVEATGSLTNWNVQARRRGVSPLEAYTLAARELVERLWRFAPEKKATPKVLMLHASEKTTSNSVALGTRICERLQPNCEVTEISLQNGTIFDCRGCSYKACAHFASQNSCFYGGSIVEDVYPAIMACDALLLLCPNYNDSVSANIMACINRLTSLLVFNTLYDKYLYAVVVSGYSGSDLVAQQVLGALCCNKTFMLPPRFCLMQTANDPGDALRAPGIEERLDAFAQSMLQTMR